MQTTLFGSVSIDLVGAQNIGTLLRTQWPLAGLAGFAGPASCFIITFARYYSGMTFSKAFHLFFFIASGISFLSSAVLSYLYILQLKLRREQPGEEDAENGEEGEQDVEVIKVGEEGV